MDLHLQVGLDNLVELVDLEDLLDQVDLEV